MWGRYPSQKLLKHHWPGFAKVGAAAVHAVVTVTSVTDAAALAPVQQHGHWSLLSDLHKHMAHRLIAGSGYQHPLLGQAAAAL